ncbi:hypothetical protein HW932_20145 [Allochromatium humboldtianum]|uniref:Uncharacterized protein n=1 Tax=Allochromatium humboldtianum TaxID=504901 RepID=A0A850RRM6_9GAMM|nr:hypothetical protein [Allochromatium humboldtianum]NVZ11563.1 hypothetical protein [Allochromatium humboldtianum]
MYQESCNDTTADHHPALDTPVMDDELDQDVHRMEMLVELAMEQDYPVPKLGERTFWTADGLEYCPILTRQEVVYAGYLQCDGQTIHVEFPAPVGATSAQKDRLFVRALIAAGCLIKLRVKPRPSGRGRIALRWAWHVEFYVLNFSMSEF